MQPMHIMTVNDRDVSFQQGKTILEVCWDEHIPIPTMCNDGKLKQYGGCGLCIVEVAGLPKPLTSCTTYAERGMQISTDSPHLSKLRKTIIELLLSNHPNNCTCCTATGNCDLQRIANRYNADLTKYAQQQWSLPIKEENPLILYEPEKCIVCGRCTRICNEVAMARFAEVTRRNSYAIPITASTVQRSYNACLLCGECVSICPTGALSQLKAITADISLQHGPLRLQLNRQSNAEFPPKSCIAITDYDQP